jgi:hypothetical protein
MALVDSVLANSLKTIFQTMKNSASDTPKDDAWLADQLAKAIDDQIKTVEIATQIPAASVVVQVTGQAVGVPNTAPLPVTQVSVS